MKRTGQSPEQDQYRALMDDIEMPGRVHDRVMREAHRLRTAEAVHAKPTRRPRTCNQSGYRTRRFVTAVIAAACVLALASGVAFAISQQLDNATAKNSFALDAGTDDFGYGGFTKVWRSDPEIDPNNADNAPDSGQRYLSVAHLFDLSCTGTNVASLTYTVEGDRVLFYTNARMPEFSYQEGDDPYTEDRTTSFTVNYDEQNANKTEIWHALRVSFPLEGEVAELYDATTGEFYGDRRKWDVNMHENLNALLIRKYADMIAQARLKVKAPALGDRRKAELEDLAILTGGEVITPDRGLTLADARKSMLGRAASVQITKDRTTILGGKGKPEAIEQRCDQLRAQIETEKIDYDRDVLRERLAKLSSGIAVMEVGAATESEMNEIRSRIQDALLATRSAAEQGLVAGGGVALLQAASALDGLVCENAEEQLGIDILRKALEVPLRALAENAGYRGDVAVEKVKELPLGQGLDCMTGEYGDMIGRGIADPAKVTVTALQAAASVASLILITNASVSEMVPEED